MNEKYSEAGQAIKDVMSVSVARAWGGGIVGAILASVLGWFAFDWLVGQGFYALALPGALVGLGFGFFSKRPMIAGGIFCAVVGFVLMLACEWNSFPWNKDGSFGYFVQHIHELKSVTWLFLILGTLMSFWFGRGR